MVHVDSDEVHFEVYAIRDDDVKRYRLKKERVCKDRFSKRLYVVVRDDYCQKGPTIYSMEKWVGLERIPYGSKHFYDSMQLVFKNNEFVFEMPGLKPGRGYETCTSVSKANKEMDNPLLENIKSAEMLLCSYEHFLRGINKEIVVRQYKHGDEGVREYEEEKRNRRYK